MNAYTAPSAPPPAKKGMPTWAIVLIVVLGSVVLLVGVVGVLAVAGVRTYIANAKQAEARNAVTQMARDAAEAYARDGKLCPSASAPVPATVPRGVKYQSSLADWQKDKAANAGFDCLKFEMDQPQYFQYAYTSTPTSFTVTAHGDLDGDGHTSSFVLEGRVVGTSVTIAPSIAETDPGE